MSYSNTDAPVIPGVNKPRLFYGYIIVFCSFVILMIAWGAQYSYGVFFKPMLKE